MRRFGVGPVSSLASCATDRINDGCLIIYLECGRVTGLPVLHSGSHSIIGSGGSFHSLGSSLSQQLTVSTLGESIRLANKIYNLYPFGNELNVLVVLRTNCLIHRVLLHGLYKVRVMVKTHLVFLTSSWTLSLTFTFLPNII